MKNKIIYLIILLLNSLPVIAHNEFYRRSTSNQCDLVEVTATNNINILKWQSYTNIPIAANWSLDFPSEINLYTVADQFANAVSNWELFSGQSSLFDVQQDFGQNVHIRFANSTDVFPMPLSAYKYGGTPLCMQNINGTDFIVHSWASDPCGQTKGHSWILLNNTTGRSFQWRTDHFIPSISEIDFEYTICHELGHLLGLAHCSYSYPESMMHDSPPYGNFVSPFPTPKDIEGLNILKDQNPTTPLVLNPFRNRQHAFFEYELEVFFNSQGKPDIININNEIPIQIISSIPETKLFTVPEKNKIKKGKK